MPPDATALEAYCRPCEVKWNGRDTDICWLCGVQVSKDDVEDDPAQHYLQALAYEASFRRQLLNRQVPGGQTHHDS